MAKQKIMVDHAILSTSAGVISRLAGEYEQQYKKLFTEVTNMGAAWKGVDNTAFVNRITPFEEGFKAMKALMEEYAEFLRLSSKNYKNTQDAIAESARKLSN